ncbi:MAG: HAD-IA family hydrolase [Anaerolineae bacterium]
MTKALLWDMDGVLVDTGEAHFAAWKALFEGHEWTITREDFEKTFGMSNIPILKELLGEGLPEAQLLDLAAEKEARFREMIEPHVNLLPGVEKWLRWARKERYRQAVASSGEMANIVAILAAFEIANYFDAVVSGAFLPHSKPHPAIFLQAAASVGAEPQDSLVLEDGLVGIEAAHRAGIACIAVTTTHSAEELSDAQVVVSDLNELSEKTLRRLFP